MMLHEDKSQFCYFIKVIGQRAKIREDIMEKDYYISLFLDELSKKQADVKMYFKGGTALYKIMDEPRRFSEDIDLTVEIRGLSKTQAKKHLEKASQKFETLPRLNGDPMEENNKGSITCVYGYDSIFEKTTDELQRFGKLKVEATSFTVSEPVTTYKVIPLLYKYADENEKKILDEFSCSPTYVQAISLERMFTDKLLAAEFYLNRNLFDTAKHIYDIYVLMGNPNIQIMLDDEKAFFNYLSYKRIEEQSRIGSDLASKPLNELKVFSSLINQDFIKQFNKMQDVYVFDPKYRLSIEDIIPSMKELETRVCDISDKEQEFLRSDAFRKLSSTFTINSSVTEKESLKTPKKSPKSDMTDN